MEPVVIICMILRLQEEINQVLAMPSMGQHGLIARCGRKNLCQIVFFRSHSLLIILFNKKNFVITI